MISKANLGQQLTPPQGGLMHSQLSTPLPIPGCRWAWGQEVQGCLSAPPPQFFLP